MARNFKATFSYSFDHDKGQKSVVSGNFSIGCFEFSLVDFPFSPRLSL